MDDCRRDSRILLFRTYSDKGTRRTSDERGSTHRYILPRLIYFTRPIRLKAPFLRSHTIQSSHAGGVIPRTRQRAGIFPICAEEGKPKFVPLYDSPRFSYRSRMLSHEDSAENARIADECRRGYILSDYTFSRVTTPELDMWLPRITGNSSSYLESYQSWVGMTKQNMTAVEVSETFDPDGMPAGRLNSDGKRVKGVSYRPTYLQNLSFFLSYQVGYMYFRYLLWNFMGRQNDIPSTGEIDHGNFITGIPALDNLMLGDQSLMPSDASSDNPGRNVYFGIPLILGIIGIIFLLRSGKTGKRICSVVLLLFLLTGMAIVVYLNQTPGEPREPRLFIYRLLHGIRYMDSLRNGCLGFMAIPHGATQAYQAMGGDCRDYRNNATPSGVYGLREFRRP